MLVVIKKSVLANKIISSLCNEAKVYDISVHKRGFVLIAAGQLSEKEGFMLQHYQLVPLQLNLSVFSLQALMAQCLHCFVPFLVGKVS